MISLITNLEQKLTQSKTLARTWPPVAYCERFHLDAK